MADPVRRSTAQRIAAVKARVSIGAVVGRDVKLSGSSSSAQRRGPCPFHHGKSASFALVNAASGDGFGYCFGCQWSGDVLTYLQDAKGWSFADALAALESEAGLSDHAVAAPERGPVQRERNPTRVARREKVLVETLDMARAIWRRARPDHAAVRRYFTGRGVPAAVLSDARLAQFRFLGACPLMQWELRGPDDSRAWPRDTLNAPAVVAMVRRPVWLRDGMAGQPDDGDRRHGAAGDISPGDQTGRLEFVPCGLHVTYLDPDGTGTMVRRKPWAKPDDPDPLFPKRKMLGPIGHGAVLLGEYHPAAHLWVGEGNETVLSGMALGAVRHAAEGRGPANVRPAASMPGALAHLGELPADWVGVATLSLDNLQGAPAKWNGGIWPLHALRGDPERPGFTIPAHRGPVTGLIDSDMAPLANQKVVERKGGPILTRALIGAERAAICGELFVHSWRAAGVHAVRAARAPLGMDFNDAIRAEAV